MLTRLSNRSVLAGLALATALAACGGDDNGNAPKDAAIDAPATPDSLCGANASFTGEVIDWDANTSVFCGVNQAKVAAGATNDTTNPNGRFVLCVPHAQTVLAITPPTDPSECVTGQTYAKFGILVLTSEAIAAGALASARMLTNERISTMYDPKKLSYNANAAQIVVHLTGPAHAVTISTANHDPVQQFDGTTWAAAPTSGPTTGTEVLFPNVALTDTVTVSVDGGSPASVSLSTGANTLAADKFTYVTFITK